MNVSRVVALSSVVVVLSLSIAGAQQGAPPMPKPGPEHDVLKMDLGTWNATVEVNQGPGKPTTSKGVEVNTIGCGGLCLITDFKGEMMPGMPFHGHGVATWDASRKVYRGSWVDSMSQGLLLAEGKWDPATKTATSTMEGPDATGKIVKMRSVVTYPSATSRVMTMYGPGPDGKEMQMMKISYTKK
jgi:Protein of unknown function (DUF1579)